MASTDSNTSPQPKGPVSSESAAFQQMKPAVRNLLRVLHVAVILLSVMLLYAVTHDALYNISFLTDPDYLQLQFWICLFFIFEAIAEWALTPDRRRNLLRTLLVVIICVPYTSLVHHFHWEVSLEVYYLLRIMPLVRAAIVLVIMWGIMDKDWVTGLFGSYIIIMIVTLYALSLMFYVEEHHFNPMVTDYWQSLWYSVMQLNTCGSNITPVTYAGRVIGIVLSIEGLVLFPVFTVFVTKAFGNQDQQNQQEAS